MRPLSPVVAEGVPEVRLRTGPTTVPAVHDGRTYLMRYEPTAEDLSRLMNGGSLYAAAIVVDGAPVVVLATEPPVVDVCCPDGVRQVRGEL